MSKFIVDAPNENKRKLFASVEIEDCVNRFVTELIKRGYEELINGDYQTRCFAKRSDIIHTYLGTFCNMFSKKDPVELWEDKFATSEKFIVLHEVYKHNGTKENSSIEIAIYNTEENKNNSVPEYCGEGNNQRCFFEACNWLNTKRIRKVKPTISDKVLLKCLDEVEEELKKIVLPDYSKFEKDRKDFHKDTKEDWIKAKLGKKLE